MPIVQYLPLIAKRVEDFYNSGYANTIINVVMSSPVNEIAQFHITRQDTFQDTLNELISRIQLFLIMQVQITVNSSTVSTQCDNKDDYIKLKKKLEFKKYLVKENLAGSLEIT